MEKLKRPDGYPFSGKKDFCMFYPASNKYHRCKKDPSSCIFYDACFELEPQVFTGDELF